MKSLPTIIIIIFSLCNYSCKNKDLQTNIAAGQLISEKLQGEKMELYASHQNTPIKKDYLKYILYNPLVLRNNIMDSSAAASFCAIQLYKTLSSNTIKDNEGISIAFSKENNKPYYYSMEELNDVNKATNVINSFFNYALKNKWNDASNFIDTNLFNIDTMHNQLSKLSSYINDPVIYYTFTNKQFELKENHVSDCLIFTIQMLDKYNNNQLYLNVGTYKYENDQKIIGIQNYQ